MLMFSNIALVLILPVLFPYCDVNDLIELDMLECIKYTF